MKILFVNHLLDSKSGGGTAERTLQLAIYLAKEGHECSILTLDIGLDNSLTKNIQGIHIHALTCINKRFFIPFVKQSKIRELVRNVDIVHLSGHWTLLNAIVYKECKFNETPYIFCPAGALETFGRSLILKNIYQYIVGNSILRNAKYCVAITNREGDLFKVHGVDSQKIKVIPNGIDPDQYYISECGKNSSDFRESVNLNDSPYILFLGRLNYIKGPDLLIESFAMIESRWPSYHLVIAGPDDGMLEALKKRSVALGLTQRIHFTGYIGGATKVAALKGASMLGITSRSEAMSIVVLEAGICICPVLFTNTCGLDDFARMNLGYEVDVNVSAIANGINHILNDSNEAARRAALLNEHVKTSFLWSVQAKHYETLAANILFEFSK